MTGGSCDDERFVLIVGAGPTGLVLALSLARRGVAFRIIDTASGPGLASRAMAVQARTLEFYQQLGIAEAIVARGIRMQAMHLRRDGREVAVLPLGDMGGGISPFPFVLTYPQDDHERFLVATLATLGVAVEWNTTLASFTQDETGVSALLDKGGTAETCEAAFLCGCDGAHSSVRRGLGLGFAGGTYAQLFYVIDAEIAGTFASDGFMNLGAKAFALMLPVRSTRMHRLIGLVPQTLEDKTDVTFEDLRSTIEPLIGAHVTKVNWFSTYRSHHRIATRFQVGRCFLSGDAGHVHSPAGGQGMNTGIGDAVNLAWKLADVLRGRAASAILDSYEVERMAFAKTLVKTTDRAFRGAIQGGLAGTVLRTWLLPVLLPRLARLPAVRRLIFATVSQTQITYRGSPLAAARAGNVHGGDRLPWVESLDNHAPLASLDWQIHVYGVPRAALAKAAAASRLPVHAFAWNDAVGHAGFARTRPTSSGPTAMWRSPCRIKAPAICGTWSPRGGSGLGEGRLR